MLFPEVISPEEELIRPGINPTIRRGPSIRMGDVSSMDYQPGSPLDQIGQNAVAAIPTSRMLTPEPTIASLEPLPEATPDRTGIGRYYPSMRAAQGEAEQQALVEPGEQYQAYERMRDTRPEAKKGFKGRLLAALKGIGYSGNLAGGIVGAFSPQTIRDYEWRNRDIPEALERAQIEQGEQARQLSAGGRMADLTGMNPWTGEPTEAAQERTARREDTQSYRRMVDQDRDAARQNQAIAMAIRAQAEWDARHPGEPYPEHVTRALPNLVGERAPKSVKPQKAYVQTKTGPDGVEYGLTAEGQWEPMATREGQPFKPFQRSELTPNERATQERFELNERQQGWSDARKAFDDVQKAINEAKTLRGLRNEPLDELKARQEEAWNAALALADQAIAAYPEYMKAGPRQRGFADIVWAGGTKPRVQAAPRANGGGTAPVLKAANVAEAAKRKGMTVDAFKQWFETQGGVIAPD